MIKSPVPDFGSIHVFYTRADQISDPCLLKQYRACLSPAEIQKADRYMKPSDRHLSLVSRALVRYVIGEVTRQDPQSLNFLTNEHGKPFLVGLPDIHFNLSHSHGAAVCALCRNAPVGVDVEDVGRHTDFSIAKRFFSFCEAELVSRAPEAEKRKLFFDIWTLKEAYIKAVGRGLSIPLNSFSFNANEAGIQITFSDTGRVEPTWQFFQWRPESGKIVAVAGRSASPIVFKHFWCVPFVGIDPNSLIF
ncbi:phosphopantetheinyl transferase [Desulfobacter hydrogenophilus]|uniref:Phosphopantetheinyl transferase n=2 Tax=Desulfobacter hydrogenophilus TaxID=2291 RepID=A0A328F9R9_9BACT|nr:4'-phosphopantetheinyl transferase superfamily protein [Desulfobacter hydrogenophilus]NDY73017.1 4'-phosphopantetheinyl transferase superfamily protein [Desulfobacter hydrogenophilus]QBH15675.1 4'-phosphopantetheinyl transferase superfamily protein [Desulfobacter hydrogenophilus]RAM00966.1 phosphopantetheinyl transferase [Desulfobacter hydrogenophilus]